MKQETQVSERVKEIRKALDLNQREYAERLKVAVSSISDVENGKYSPNFELVRNLVVEFKLNVDYLLFGEGEMFKNPGRELFLRLEDRQKEFAEKLGAANSSLSEIESGQTKPGYDFLVSISRVFKANLYYILFGTGEMIIEPSGIDDQPGVYYAANKEEMERFFHHFRRSSILQLKIVAYFKTVMMKEGEDILREITDKAGKGVEADRKEGHGKTSKGKVATKE